MLLGTKSCCPRRLQQEVNQGMLTDERVYHVLSVGVESEAVVDKGGEYVWRSSKEQADSARVPKSVDERGKIIGLVKDMLTLCA